MKSYKLEIEQDEDPMNPRIEWDNTTTMICFHNRYNLGDKHNYKSDDYSGWQELKEQLQNDYKILMIKPLYMYDHSGITISTKPFSCSWDSGQIGWVFIDETRLQYMSGDASGFNELNLEEIIDGEVKGYDQYLTGEVYRITINEVEICSMGHQHETMLESIGGYYGYEYAEQEGQELLKHYEKEIALVKANED